MVDNIIMCVYLSVQVAYMYIYDTYCCYWGKGSGRKSCAFRCSSHVIISNWSFNAKHFLHFWIGNLNRSENHNYGEKVFHLLAVNNL